MADKKLATKATKDFIYSVLALVIYNGVLQLAVYPYLNGKMGADAFGTVLYLISAISIMGSSFGTAASYSRMVAASQRTHENGDYNLFLLIIAGLCIPVSAIVLAALGSFHVLSFVGLLVLMIVTVFRYYADVEYRMNIKFSQYFIFYTLIAVGYMLGIAAYSVHSSWVIVLLLGELLAIVFTIIVGTIFKAPFLRRSSNFAENMRSVWTLSLSNLVSVVILNSDRMLLRLVVGAKEVTVFYTATLIGKIIAMLTTPLNGVIISYMTNYHIKLNKKKFGLICGIGLIISALGAIACTVVSYVFVKIMYPDVFEMAKPLFLIANGSQILYFVSGSLMVIVMSFTKEKLQLLINIIYMVIFVVIVVPSTFMFGLNGLAVGLLITNAARLLVVAGLGIKYLNH